MNRQTIALIVTLAAAACTPSYDQSAVPDASYDLRVAMNRCESAQAGRDQTNYSEFTACQVTAERAFAVAIHLQKMDAFDIYASRMEQLAADRDTQHLSLEETRTRVDAIRKDYWAACACNIQRRRAPAFYNSGGDIGPFYQPPYGGGGGGDPGISASTPSPYGQGGVHF